MFQTVRSAFEYQGQKCSACSRLYVPDTIWPEVKRKLLQQHARITMGPVDKWSHFMSSVIDQKAFSKIKGYIDQAKHAGSNVVEILAGGTCDDSRGYYIQPTILLTRDPLYKTMTEEIFGPVLTVYVYPATQFEQTVWFIYRYHLMH